MSAIRPRNADDLTPAELTSAAIDMDLVLGSKFNQFDRFRREADISSSTCSTE
jgi:hypothetical protein